MRTTGGKLAAISTWIDTSDANIERDTEALLWLRVAKVSEEAGEAIAALVGITGSNPRKGVYGTTQDVCDELLDVALTALCAVEHLQSNDGSSMSLLALHVAKVYARAGLPAERPEDEQPQRCLHGKTERHAIGDTVWDGAVKWCPGPSGTATTPARGFAEPERITGDPYREMSILDAPDFPATPEGKR